jgi:hypothetical protein
MGQAAPLSRPAAGHPAFAQAMPPASLEVDPAPRKRSRALWVVIVLLLLILLAAAGTLAYWLIAGQTF